MKRIWLDDERPAPDGWTAARWPSEVIAHIEAGDVDAVSLDHDLGDPAGGRTGYDVLLWLEREVAQERRRSVPTILIHTANPVARDRMMKARHAIGQILRLRGLR